MATHRRRAPGDPHRWWQIRIHGWCAKGAHEVAAGTWMRTRRGDHRQLHSCESCLAAEGVRRRPFTLTRDDGFDARAKRAGDT